MRELSLFAGAGGGILGTHLLGWQPIGYVEFNDYCQRVLAARIKDGHIPSAPIFGDVRAFISEGYARRYRGLVDVVTAGFPCQPFSVAGKQAAEDDPRNMWPATAEVLRIVKPRFALLENVTGLLAGSHGYFGEVLRELAALGYDVRWGVLSAADAGAPHLRKRLWVYCNANGQGEPASSEHDEASWVSGDGDVADSTERANVGEIPQPSQREVAGRNGEGDEEVADSDSQRRGLRARVQRSQRGRRQPEDRGWWATEPDVGRGLDGLAHELDLP